MGARLHPGRQIRVRAARGDGAERGQWEGGIAAAAVAVAVVAVVGIVVTPCFQCVHASCRSPYTIFFAYFTD